ncbi:alpha-glucosidase [Kosmotoga arenicorallina S304]|uniref:Alpha-glucosidase n=1 Tax=Kosmotoga arenicorallina S304 TaxID=1453497 RepID=A0A176K1V9_9BACT|nr:TIM-barrel domain-containing protein [Kosmotoga arenicorallina]OAA31000.1 alpha-glucosidase [Kosmotoga arenicorallina S304]
MNYKFKKFPGRILEIEIKSSLEDVIHESGAVIAEPIAVVDKMSSFYFHNSKIEKDEEGVFTISCKKEKWAEFKINETPKGFRLIIEIEDGDGVFGLGEEVGPLNKKGKRYEFYNTDEPDHSPSKTKLYSTFPIFIILSPKKSLGVFLDYPGYSSIDICHKEENKIIIDIAGRAFRLYLQGDTPDGITANFVELTGKPVLLPVWMLGYQQSRWSYLDEETVLSISRELRNRSIPCDVIYLDIDYMENFKVFTWDKAKFPDPGVLLSKLREMGFKVITIVDPGVKVEKNYELYEEGKKSGYFCINSSGEPFEAYVWPGKSHFPDFYNAKVRKWWGDKVSEFKAAGIAGIWNDMNEPSIFFTPDLLEEIKVTVENLSPDQGMIADFTINQIPSEKRYRDHGKNFFHRDDSGDVISNHQIHNIYGFNMAKATYEGLSNHYKNERPVIITRSAYPGIQRYGILWTGDNTSLWEHLYQEIQMLQSLAIAGVHFAGSDVGGFGGDCNGELLVRWTQFGVFQPFFRNHSAIGTRNQEPWTFGEKYEKIIKKFIELRYALLPYIYSALKEAQDTGQMIVTPMFYKWPEDEKTYEADDEYLFGSSLLVAPIYKANATGRTVYLPGIRWMNFFNRKIYEPGYYYIDAPLDSLPLFVAENSLLSMTEPAQYVEKAIWEKLNISGFVTSNASICIYEDDGASMEYLNKAFSRKRVEIWKTGDKMLARIHPEAGELLTPERKISFEIFDGKHTHVGEFIDKGEGGVVELDKELKS